MTMIADKLEDIDITLDNDALTEENFNQYWVDTKAGRGEDPINAMARKLSHQPDKNDKYLFAGFSGCGKSTELMRLKKRLDNDFLVIVFSIYDKLDPVNFSISEILLAMMAELSSFINDHCQNITMENKLLNQLENWSTVITDENKHFSSQSLETNAKASVAAGFLKFFNVMLHINGELKSGRSYSQIIKKEEKQTLSALLDIINKLLGVVKKQLPAMGKKNILFVIEDLEKVTLSTVEKLFSEYVSQLTALHCPVIYTFPIAMVYHSRTNFIKSRFDDPYILPMIKVHEKNGDDNPAGINAIKSIIEKRIKGNLIPTEVIHRVILYSGGCLRDVFRLLKTAADHALDENRSSMNESDFKYSAVKLKNDYYNSISWDRELNLTTRDFLNILKICCDSEDKKPEDVPGMMILKHNMCVLGYNGEQWFDVHPAVKEILADKKL